MLRKPPLGEASACTASTRTGHGPPQTLETVPNPQFIAFDRQQKFIYAVHGDGGTEVSSYAIDKTSGRISFLNKQPTGGNNSTHLTLDPTNRHIVIGNGIGVAVFPINPDGSCDTSTAMSIGGAQLYER